MTRVIDTSQISTADSAVYYANEEPVTPTKIDEPSRVQIHMTQERMEGVKVGLWRRAQNNDMDAMITLLARFVIDSSGRWMPKDKAIEALDELTFAELSETIAQMGELANEVAAPKGQES